MDLPDKKVLKSEQNNMYLTYFRRIYKQTLFRDQEAVGSNPATRTMWTRVGVLNRFLRLSNTPTLVLWEKVLLFQAFSFLMHSPVINIAKTKGAGFVVEKRKIPSFEPLVQISLSALFFAHGAIRTHPVSYS